MTGLPNRALFDDRPEHGLAQAKRHGFTVAVMFVDFDSFKAMNDLHGHAVGDALLQSVADRLQENTRVDDTVSRYGGDEFLYLLMSIDDDKHVLQIAEKIAAAIQMQCALSVGNVIVKSSIGISIFPKDGDTASALIESADKAMYQAKRAKALIPLVDSQSEKTGDSAGLESRVVRREFPRVEAAEGAGPLIAVV